MSNEEVEEFAKELEKPKKEPKQKIKWVCPFCSGNKLKKEKILFNDEELTLEIKEDLGLILVVMYNNEDEQIYESTFPIKYCPVCGRKIKEKYRKLNN